MNPDLVKLVAIVLGTVVSAPFVLASVRAFFFFGQMSHAVKTVEGEVAAIKQVMERFSERVGLAMADHEKRLTLLEATYEAQVVDIRRAHESNLLVYQQGVKVLEYAETLIRKSEHRDPVL
jgi:hypothetical protein